MTENDNKNDKLQNMFDDVTNTDVDESSVKKQLMNKKKDKKTVPLIIAGLAVVALVGSGIYFAPKFLNNNTSTVTSTEDSSSKTSSSKSTTSSTGTSQDLAEIYEESETPIKVAKWVKQPYANQIVDDPATLKTNAIAAAEDSIFVNTSNGFVSTEDGYTDDVNNATNSDGSQNENYSYQTKENIEYAWSIYSQRILNPVFGGWNTLPWGLGPDLVQTGIQSEDWRSMFTERWWNENIVATGTFNALPIYADWNGDRWGGANVADNAMGIWFGEITSMTSYSEPSSDQYTQAGSVIIINANIQFTAKDPDGKNIVRTGTLYMKLVANMNNTDPLYRNVIDEVTLTVNS